MDGYEDLPSKGKTSDPYGDIPVAKPTGGAAFGIYPKQRATPSTPQTKEAAQKASEKMADVMGFTVPEEPEMSPAAVGLSAGMGGVAGRYGPAALKKTGAMVSKIPTPATRAAGTAMQALGTGLQNIPSTRRTLIPAAAMGGTELAAQTGEQFGVPRAASELAALGLGPATGRKIGEALVGTTTRTGEALAKKAEQLGFKLSPAQTRADIPVPAKGATFSAEKNQTLANQLASEGTGKKVTEISPEFIGKRLKDLGKEYDKLYKGKQFRVDPSISNDLQNILAKEQELGVAGVSTVKQAAQTMLDTLQRQGPVVIGDDLQRLRNALTERARSTASRGNAHEIYELVDKIDAAVAARNPQFKTALDELRPQYRNSVILEDLYRQGGIKQGNISLEKLGEMLRGKRDVLRRTAKDIDELGELGRELKLRARWETEGRAATAGEDILGQLFGTGADIAGKISGTRGSTARSLQRYLSE